MATKVIRKEHLLGQEEAKLTSSEDENGSLKGVGLGRTCESEKLSGGDGLLGLLSVVKNAVVEVVGVKEQVHLRVDVGVRQVTGNVVVGRQSGEVNWRNVVGQTKRLDDRVDGRSVNGSSETERLVEVGLLEIASGTEVTDERGVHRETGKNDTVGDVGVHGSEEVGLGGAKGVTDVDDLGEGVVDLREAAVAELLGHGSERGNLQS